METENTGVCKCRFANEERLWNAFERHFDAAAFLQQWIVDHKQLTGDVS